MIGLGLGLFQQLGVSTGGGPSLTLREEILALSSTTETGRQSIEALNVVDINAVPAGMRWRADTEVLYVEGTDMVLDDYDFRGHRLEVTGQRIELNNCLIGYAYAGTNYGTTANYDLTIGVDAEDVSFNHCSVDGGGYLGRRNTVVFDGIAPAAAIRTLFHRCRWSNIPGDAWKPGGVDTVMSECYFDRPMNVPPSATLYDPALTYDTGDDVLFLTGAGSYRLYVALQAVPAGEAPTGTTVDTAYWAVNDYHYDVIQVASFTDLIIKDTLIDCRDRIEGAELPDAVGVNASFMFSPNTNRPRTYDNLMISGAVVVDPFGGFKPTTFSKNIREWDVAIEYSIGVQLYCRVGLVNYQSLVDANIGNDPTSTSGFWIPVRDVKMPGPMFAEHCWIGTGTNGVNELFSDETPARGISNVFSERTGLPLESVDLQVTVARPEPAFGSTRTPLPPISVSGPASRFVVTPTAWVEVTRAGAQVSGLPLYIGGTPSALLFADGSSPFIVDGSGITVVKDGADYVVEMFDDSGLPMSGPLEITYGTATVVTGSAVAPSGPVWGFVDDTAPVLSSPSLAANGTTALDWSVDTDTLEGAFYAVLVPSAATAPDADQIIAGTDGDGNAATATETVAGGAVSASGQFTGLVPATAYRAYITQLDVAENQADVVTDSSTTDNDVATFTIGATGPYYVADANVPAITTRIDHKVRMMLPSGVAKRGSTQYLFTQESQGFDVKISFSTTTDAASVLITNIETNGGDKVTPVDKLLFSMDRDVWFDLEIYADQVDEEVQFSVDGGAPITRAFTGVSTGEFTPKKISYFAKTNGADMLPEGIVLQFIETEFTTDGTTSLIKRIDATNYDSDPWKRPL